MIYGHWRLQLELLEIKTVSVLCPCANISTKCFFPRYEMTTGISNRAKSGWNSLLGLGLILLLMGPRKLGGNGREIIISN